MLKTFERSHLAAFSEHDKQGATLALESGKVLYLPGHVCSLSSDDQDALWSPKLLDGKHKNVSFSYETKRLGGISKELSHPLTAQLQIIMEHFANFAKQSVVEILPWYETALQWGRTSYRPAEIEGRVYSKRKDDTRLHVDSFPATPVHGRRILRVFCNINPQGAPRVWRLGEPFPKVLDRFANRIPVYNSLKAKLLHLVHVTKTQRSAYDHYQLNLHDAMKLDDDYQVEVRRQQIDFAAQSTWVVFTDQVSHAALKGQFLLEQTFYLPVEAMLDPQLSPLKHWEKMRPNCFRKNLSEVSLV